ncbi:hypothetical protein SEA_PHERRISBUELLER_42 [Mycobacterium phage PherrisBueller]|nr:hypothetical protein SEA_PHERRISBUELLER_42 [Mycobacterium phage PherrisBueller]
MNKHAYESGFGVDHAIKTAEQFAVSLFGRIGEPDYQGRHRLPDVRFSQELPDAAVYWSPNRKAFFRRDDSLPSGWVQRIYPRVATSFRTAE